MAFENLKNMTSKQKIFFGIIGFAFAVIVAIIYLGSRPEETPVELQASAKVAKPGGGVTSASTPSPERQQIEQSYQEDIELEALSTPDTSLVAPADFGLSSTPGDRNQKGLNRQRANLSNLGEIKGASSSRGQQDEYAPGYGGLTQAQWEALNRIRQGIVDRKRDFMAALIEGDSDYSSIAVVKNEYLEQNKSQLQGNAQYFTDANGQLRDANGNLVQLASNQPTGGTNGVDAFGYPNGDPDAVVNHGDGEAFGLTAAGQRASRFEWHPGEIVFGVIDTSVNSDSPSPVRASVLSGPLRGAVLIGNFESPGLDGLVLRFTSITWKGFSSAVNLVAIDADTARTAMASDVDNHTFSRWGALLLAGAGRGIKTLLENDGQQVVPSNNGAVIITRPRATTARLVLSTIGEASDVAIEQVRENFERKPTITIDRGEEVGLMFMGKFSANWLPERKELAIR